MALCRERGEEGRLPFLIFLAASLLLVPRLANAEDLGSYIRRTYLTSDQTYGYKAVNRYSAVGTITPLEDGDPLRRRIADQVRRTVLPQLRTQGKCRSCRFVPMDVLQTNRGVFASYRYEKVSASRTDPGAENALVKTKKEPYFFGIALVQGRHTASESVSVTREDPETGGYTKELWDIFQFRDQTYVLVLAKRYESHNFEAFVVDNSQLRQVLAFEYGGL